VLKVQGPTVGEPGMFRPGREEKDETFRWWVTEGGYTVDEPELYASFRHFYDPRHAEMGTAAYLTDHLNELGAYFNGLAAGLAVTGKPIGSAIVREIGKNPEVGEGPGSVAGVGHRHLHLCDENRRPAGPVRHVHNPLTMNKERPRGAIRTRAHLSAG
jgi:hypothetical protein